MYVSTNNDPLVLRRGLSVFGLEISDRLHNESNALIVKQLIGTDNTKPHRKRLTCFLHGFDQW